MGRHRRDTSLLGTVATGLCYTFQGGDSGIHTSGPPYCQAYNFKTNKAETGTQPTINQDKRSQSPCAPSNPGLSRLGARSAAPGVRSKTRGADGHPLCDRAPFLASTVPVHGTWAGAGTSACLRSSSDDTMRSATGIGSQRLAAPPAKDGRALRVPSAGVDGEGTSVLREDRHVRGRVSTTIGSQGAPWRAAAHPRAELVPAQAPARAGGEKSESTTPVFSCLVPRPTACPANIGGSRGVVRSERGGRGEYRRECARVPPLVLFHW